MKVSSSIFSVVVILLSLFYKTTAIYCYYCNSANNSACIELDSLDDETRARIIPIVNCETAVPSPVTVNFFCRKIVQTIFHTHKETELRVTRGCGWVRHHKECYRADNRDHLETVCQCFQDHCNSADGPNPFAAAILFLLFAVVLYFYR